MTILWHDQSPNLSSKRCRSLSSSIKDAFSDCYGCKRSHSVSSDEEDQTPTMISYFNIDELQVVSIVRARALEAKLKRKSILWDESFSSVFYPVTLSELFKRTSNRQEAHNSNQKKQDENDNEDFILAASHFSSIGSVASEFFSVNTSFSESWALEEVVELFPELRRRSIIQEFSHCKGWPFGLCRRAMLLPPLPKSPSDSWSWCNRSKIVKAH